MWGVILCAPVRAAMIKSDHETVHERSAVFEIARRPPPTHARTREGYGRRSSGSLAIFAAILLASSRGLFHSLLRKASHR
jgi:hypothetical protein